MNKESITLENVHTHSVPLAEHPLKWKFMDHNEQLSNEFLDQIIPLTPEAAKFLWRFESTQRYFDSPATLGKYFNNHTELAFGSNDSDKVKKWLYARGIPFDQKVFWITQPDCGFVLTWKMVIKFSGELFFGSDELIWDKTLNWALMFDHNDVLYYGSNRNFDSEQHSNEIEELNKILNQHKQNFSK